MFNFHGDEIGPQWKFAFMNQMLTKGWNQYIWVTKKYMFLGIVLWFIFILSRTWINRDMYQILATTKCAPSVFHIRSFKICCFQEINENIELTWVLQAPKEICGMFEQKQSCFHHAFYYFSVSLEKSNWKVGRIEF